MAVYKRGYQRYTGPLTGRWTRFMVLPRYAWQKLYEQRLVLLLTIVSFIWPLLCAGFIYLTNHVELLQGLDKDFLDRAFTRIDQSIAMAALFTGFHLRVKAIAALTQSGSTALWMSRHNSGCPIYALTPEVASQRKMALYRNVHPLFLEQTAERDAVLQAAENLLLREGQVQDGDLIVLTIGEPMGKSGGTNTMKIVKVGEHRT